LTKLDKNQPITLQKIKFMADITKCNGENCPHKDGCYRFTAKGDEYQSYFVDPPIEDGKCDYYWGENAKGIWNDPIETTDSE
jgi:hypothetical protein